MDSTEAAMAKLARAQDAYAKGMELIGITSAGAIGIVVALKPTGVSGSFELRVAVGLLFLATIGAVAWFMSKGTQYYMMSREMLKDPSDEVSVREPWWGRVARVSTMSAYILGFYFLFISL